MFVNLTGWPQGHCFGEGADTGGELLRTRTVFETALAVLCMEMVLSAARGQSPGRCSILVMWHLLRPLHNFQAFVEAAAESHCWDICREWGVQAPFHADAFNAQAWLADGRMCFKAVQDAHGTTADVSFFFLLKRRSSDRGWRGDQAEHPYVLQALSRAVLRQHLFIEDLHDECVLPDTRDFRDQVRTYKTHTGRAVTVAEAKRCLRMLRLRSFCDRELHTELGLPYSFSKQRLQPGVDHHNLPSCIPAFFLSNAVLSAIAKESSVGRRVANRPRTDAVLNVLLSCGNAYDRMANWWPHNGQLATSAVAKSTATDCAHEVAPHTLFCAGADQQQAWDHALGQTAVPQQSPQCPSFQHYSEALLGVAGSGCCAATWKQIAVPTITVHLQYLHERAGCPDFCKSPAALHGALVMIPMVPSLCAHTVDLNDFIMQVARVTADSFLSSGRGRWLRSQGRLVLNVSRHKKEDFELRGHRFLVQACHSDRPAAALVWSKEGDSDVELLHFYQAMGLAKQHPQQQMCLARVRDFYLAHTLVMEASKMLSIQRVQLRGIHKEEAVNKSMLQLWHELKPSLPLVSSRLAEDATLSALAMDAAAADSLRACWDFLLRRKHLCRTTT